MNATTRELRGLDFENSALGRRTCELLVRFGIVFLLNCGHTILLARCSVLVMKCTVRLLRAWPVVLDFVLPSAYDAVLRVSMLSDTLLRNSRGAGQSHSRGEAQTSMCPLAAVEDHTPSAGCIAATRGASTTGS